MYLKENEKANLYDQDVSSLTQPFIALSFLVESTEIIPELYHFTLFRKTTRYLLLSFFICPYEFLGGNHKSS